RSPQPLLARQPVRLRDLPSFPTRRSSDLAGGSIGSELCRQIFSLNPESLVMLDRDETSLHGVELSLFGSALLMSPNTVLGDISRDRKSTRLNSSHVSISYAVFCLTKNRQR